MTRGALVAMAVLAMAGMAMGQATWSFGAVTADNSAGDVTVTVPLYLQGAGSIDGVNLYLSVASPLQFTSISHLEAGMLFAGNGDDIAANIGDGTIDKNIAANTGSVSAASKVLVANLSVLVPATAAQKDYSISTGQDWGWMTLVSSPVAGGAELESTQGTGIITVIPEPATALLALIGLPLLRRRTA